MRILLLCGDRGIPLQGPSGASAHLRAVARALGRAGHEVVVATPRAADHRGAVAGLRQIRTLHSPPRNHRWLGPWRERGETWDARRLVRDVGDIDLIWERHSLFVDAGARLAQRLGVPRLVELNAPLSLERPNVRDLAYARRVERDSLRSAQRVLAVSPWLVNWATEQGCSNATWVANGTDVCPGDRERGRNDHGLDGPVAVWLGSCKPWHGLERLPALADALPDWTIAVAGRGPVAVPTHPRIRPIGRLEGPALNDLLAAADVGLCTNAPDRMPWVCPLKILDYRAAGLPVISTAAGCAERLGATVVHPWQPAVVAEHVRTAARQPRLVEHRSWDDVVAQSLDAVG